MTVKQKIKKLLEEFNELSVNEIVNKISVSNQMVHLALKQLLDSNEIVKLGTSPKTIYRKIDVIQTITKVENKNISEEELTFLQKNFLLVTDIGNLVEGIDAFTYWCKQRNLPLEKTIKEFILTEKK
jgi:dimeric dUTPase (all-alpha-NTP-PPase superfamily)